MMIRHRQFEHSFTFLLHVHNSLKNPYKSLEVLHFGKILELRLEYTAFI